MNASAADLSDDSESSDADTSTIAPSGEPGANAAQPDGSIGVPDASSANADSNGQQNTAPQGAGQQDGATSPELPSDDGAQGGQAGEAPSDLDHAPDVQGRMERGGQVPGGQGGEPGASDSNCLIQINGGTLVVNADGDGLDSNGYIEINGGTVFVNGASNSDDSGLDYEYGATVNGGNVILMGSAAMAEDFTGGTQAHLMERLSGSAGSTVEVIDDSGTVLVSYVSPKAFQAVTASAPGCADIIVR